MNDQTQIAREGSPFGDYIVYVDESGDHGSGTAYGAYPMFVLALCVFKKETYIASIVPAIQRLKFRTFGHDTVILHEREIRKAIGDFAFLVNEAARIQFLGDIGGVIAEADFCVIATAIRKDKLRRKPGEQGNLYHIAVQSCLERLGNHLSGRVPAPCRTHIVFEKRGKNEDNELELEFRRICDGENSARTLLPFDPVFASKQMNSCGLQLADLIARPIGRRVLDPAQSNQAYDVIEKKFDRSAEGEVMECGLVVFP